MSTRFLFEKCTKTKIYFISADVKNDDFFKMLKFLKKNA